MNTKLTKPSTPEVANNSSTQEEEKAKVKFQKLYELKVGPTNLVKSAENVP